MSKESLDYQKLCSNYYSSWEEGCCMESCEFYNHNECPVVYVNGLIADLEAKLAESEHRNEQLVDALNGEVFVNYKLPMENAQLKQQLAEKQKELEEVKKSKTYIMNFGDKVKEVQVVDDNQDKISFAVEQLKRVEKLLLDNAFNDLSVVLGEIENQIEQLTHQHEDKGE